MNSYCAVTSVFRHNNFTATFKQWQQEERAFTMGAMMPHATTAVTCCLAFPVFPKGGYPVSFWDDWIRIILGWMSSWCPVNGLRASKQVSYISQNIFYRSVHGTNRNCFLFFLLFRVMAETSSRSYLAFAGGVSRRLCCFLVHSLPHLLLFITCSLFPFLIYFTYFPLLSIRSLSTRIVPLRFQARGRRRRPNLGLICFNFCKVPPQLFVTASP